MQKRTFKFSHSSAEYYFSADFSYLKKITSPSRSIIITDDNIFRLHQKKFRGWNCIVIKPGEEYKIQSTVDSIIEQLVNMQADRQTILIGVGGGMITDITGYTAGIYMRGLRFGFAPTSLLGMIDASIGGKNGVDLGVYKNLIGTIRQPAFILYDPGFLKTLPVEEWINGSAEMIKHACIADPFLFRILEKNELPSISSDKKLLDEVVKRNVLFKTRLVQKDEFEKGPRRLLNFGHTIGHAIENQYELSHGQAVAIGMTSACHISEQLTGFTKTRQVVSLLQQYGLPTYATFNKQKVFAVLKMDKKRENQKMNFVVLEKIGKALVRSISLNKLERILDKI
jgi:3-dehydroquinate synthase